MSLEVMLKGLKTSLKGLEKAKKLLGKMTDDLIAELPEDIRPEAVQMISRARKGHVDTAELMNFASNVRDIDKEKFQKDVEEAVERVNAKKKEVEK